VKLRTTRRNFLRGVGIGATALALPFARVLSGRADTTTPKRLIGWFTPNGTIAEEWITGGGATDFTLGRILEPLAPFRDKLLFLDGLDVRGVASEGPGSGHQKGAGCLLTGMPLNDGDFGGGGGAMSGWASGISIDQHIVNELASPTRYPSLELGVYVRGSNNRHRLAYRGSDDPLPPQNSPYAVYDRLFGEPTGDADAVARLRARRTSVLDSVHGDLAELHGRLPYEHRARLEAHVESLRDVERRIESAALGGAACEDPAMGSPLDPERNENYPVMGQLQMDLLTAAFACDLTRVSTIMWSGSTSGQTFSFIDGVGSQGHHDMSHEANTASVREQLVRIERWYAEQLAYLLAKLDSIPEGDGTMLDNTVVLWGNELSDGESHNLRDHKWVLAGSAGGYFRTGRHLRFGDVPHPNLLVSIANAMGVPTTRFGHPSHCTGALTELT
jgi:hypothetical protein